MIVFDVESHKLSSGLSGGTGGTLRGPKVKP